MSCAYSNPKRGNRSCQFPNIPENELLEIGPRLIKYCILHVGSDQSKEAEKKRFWNDKRLEQFQSTLYRIIEHYNQNELTLELDQVVFPEINIDNCELPKIMFINCKFLDYTTFSHSTFNAKTNFINVDFMCGAEFDSSIFKNRIEFGGNTIFHEYTTFDSSEFCGTVKFNNTIFKNAVYFNNIKKFEDNVHFVNTSFQLLDFQNSILKEQIFFTDSIFNGVINFTDVVFHGDADFSCSKNDDKSNILKAFFDGAVFHGECNFINRNFVGPTTFNTEFYKAPKFHGGHLHQDTDFEYANFYDTRAKSARSYRTLKLFMEKVRSHREEARFYAYEQKCIRNNKNTSKAIKFASWLYEVTSDYGRNIIRSILSIAVVLIAFTVFYSFLQSNVININLPIDWNNIRESFIFSIEQSVNPFYIWKINNISWILKILSTIQSLMVLGLFAILLLALRWNFKRG